MKRKEEEEEEKKDTVKISKEVLEDIRDLKPHFKSERENVDIYDDVVTKDELIDAIEERNPKKLKMLLKQEEANRLKEELKRDEEEGL